jgi:hypothetical protein
MSTSDLIAKHARATSNACRMVRTPGAARDFVRNGGSPAFRALTNGRTEEDSNITTNNTSNTNKDIRQEHSAVDEETALQDACMLRASTDYLLGKQKEELHFLEGKIAALESLERKSSRRNVSFWVEVFRSAGKDHVLRSEGAENIQRAWRANLCRRKLRYALISVMRCPSCSCRAQIPQLPAAAPPYFNFVPKFRCVSCKAIIHTRIFPGWSTWVDNVEQLIDSNSSGGGSSGAHNNMEELLQLQKEMLAADSKSRVTVHQSLKQCGVAEANVSRVERLLFTFTSFWKPTHVSAMLGSGIAFARGVAFRTGLQINPNPATEKTTAIIQSEPSSIEPVVGKINDNERTNALSETAAKAQVAALAAEAHAETHRKAGLLAKFRSVSKRVGAQKVHEKNLKLMREALAAEQQKSKLAKEELVAARKAAEQVLLEQQLLQQQQALVQPPAVTPETSSVAKYAVGTRVKAGLPDWVDKFPGEIRVVNADATYGVVFDVSCLSVWFSLYFFLFESFDSLVCFYRYIV